MPGGGYFDIDASAGQFGASPLLQLGLQAAQGAAGIAGAVSPYLGSDNEAAVKAADTKLGETEQALLFDPQIPPKPAPSMTFHDDNLKHAFRHAPQFGVRGNQNKRTLRDYEKALRTHLADPAIVVITGTLRKSQPVTHYYNPRTGLNVMKKANGDLVSGWRLSGKQLRELLTTANVP